MPTTGDKLDDEARGAPTEEGPLVDVFIDDAGNTGDHPDRKQTNLFVGGVVIPCPYSEDFWRQANEAWDYAKAVSGHHEDVEIHGSQLYGGREAFAGLALADRQRIIDLIFEPIVAHHVNFYWEGVPKHMWQDALAARGLTRQDVPLWSSSLFAYSGLLYDMLDMLYEQGQFRVTCDENSWGGAGRLLVPPERAPWPRFVHGGVAFASSARVRGLQVADLLVHTIYRANKVSLPPPGAQIALTAMDELAQEYVNKLATYKVWLPLNPTLKELREKRAGSDRG